MKPSIDFASKDITVHVPKTKELPALEFDLRDFGAIIAHIDNHVPRNPDFKRPYESVDSSGLEVVIIKS